MKQQQQQQSKAVLLAATAKMNKEEVKSLDAVAASAAKTVDDKIVLVHAGPPPVPPAPVLTEKEQQLLQIEKMLSKPITVDHRSLHAQYLAGSVPDDVVDNANYCKLQDHANEQLLSRIQIDNSNLSALDTTGAAVYTDSDGSPLRIFCGIYTMQLSHDNNVKATRNTWAKRCDGFIAFSTIDDDTIPSVNIFHEGKEAYNNMWQKSRSIWRYLYTHLINDYEYFLLGGDDMLYIIENLRAYLGSAEMTLARRERNGK